ncbi:MAG: AraC family transcriptional regulator [Bacteroidaceae bacterium]|nr:AraC family transcriptional regulator [Bacteroidaceae bacterium]
MIAFIVTMVVVNTHAKKVIDANAELVERHKALLERDAVRRVDLDARKSELDGQREEIQRLRQEVERMAAELKKNESDDVTLLRLLTREQRDRIEATEGMNDEQLMGYIEQQMDETLLFANSNLTLKDVAKTIGQTQKRVVQLFKHHEKYANLNDYLTEKRFLYACKLMRDNPQWTVEAVAQTAGFVTRRTFQDVVKSRVGLTPSQLRQSLCDQDSA